MAAAAQLLQGGAATCCAAKRLAAALIGTTLLAGGHHVVRQVSLHGRDQLELGQRQQLQLLEQIRRHSILTARDWAHWNETLAYVRGQNPAFLRDSNLEGTHLFDDGAVMAIFDRNGQRLTLQTRTGGPAAGDAALQRCLEGLHRGRQRNWALKRDGLCRGSSGAYVGTATEITDNESRQRSGASLVMVQPLNVAMPPLQVNRLKQTGLSTQLREQPSAATHGQPPALEAIEPPLWDGQGNRWMRRLPTLDDGFWTHGGSELPTLAGALAVLLRCGWMLNRRRQRRQLLLQQQRANQDLRCQERELLALLDPEPRQRPEGPPPQADQQLAFLRLLPAGPQWHQASPSGLNRSVVERFQQVLAAARHLALYDQLTALPNRRYFLERLEREHQQRRQQQQPLALLFIDLDGFKQINDRYGHAIGDQVLQRTAQLLRNELRPGDFLARFGGDEFTLLLRLEGTGGSSTLELQEQARTVAERLMQASRQQPDAAGTAAATEPVPMVSLSIGVVVADPRQCSPEDLLRRSDLAMYRHKQERASARRTG